MRQDAREAWCGTAGRDTFEVGCMCVVLEPSQAHVRCTQDSAIPAFGKVMYTPGNAEFAMLACEFDYAGHPVSGQYKPLACKVGALTLEGH